ncbi:RapZ C-terminal domain-containing protein [Streptomyces sp. CA-111067]|uniref:RapZ C-terminal domain-containing protein n=1 Tax=Streptomyces sp. CA-111067 TaxID=3240046 RepID=UPI003D97DFFF
MTATTTTTTKPSGTVRIISFGYGHGEPPVADITYDLRALLRNPHHDPAMRERTGLDGDVYDHVLETPGADRLALAATTTAQQLLVDTRADVVTVAFGCTGGRHRSVAMARRTALYIVNRYGIRTQTEHRDVAKDLLSPGIHSRERTTAFEMSDHDFLELVAFAAKAENDGYGYAFEEYRPRFSSTRLQPIATDRHAFSVLLAGYEARIAEFWKQPDADARYDAHLDNHR